MNNNKQAVFESMPIPRAIASLAVPTVISQLISLVYNVVDTFFIGRVGNSYMVAAVTVCYTLFMLTVALSNLFGVGGGSLMARLIGKGDTLNAKKVCSFAFYGSIIISLLYSLVLGLFTDPILTALGASEATIEFARQYTLLVLIIGNVPVITSAVISHLLRNTGYSTLASIGLSGGGILNIALDPLFMFVILPEGMEVFGAALATLISNTAALIFLIIVMKKKEKLAPVSLSVKAAFTIRKQDFKRLFAVGIPSSVLTGLFDLANVFLNRLMSIHGDLELAAMGITMKAERLPNAINVGLCQGMMPLVAYNYASGNRERMNGVIKTARLYGLIASGISIVLFELFASQISGVFLSTTTGNIEKSIETIAFAAVFLRIRCMASPLQFLNYHTSFCMQAMGNGKGTLLHASIRELVFYIPFMFLLNALFGVNGLASALIAGEACGAVAALIILKIWLNKNSGIKSAGTA